MFKFIRKPYFIVFTLLYFVSVFVLYKSDYPTSHILASFFSYALVLPLIAYFVSLKLRKAVASQPFFYGEWLTLTILVVYITVYFSWGDHYMSEVLIPLITDNTKTSYVLEIFKEVTFIFLIPFIIYRIAYRFTLREAGLRIPLKEIFSWPNLITFFVLSAIALLFEYIFNEDLDPLWNGEYPQGTMTLAVPALFLLLCLKVGLTQGFFFRSILQSRLSIGLNSKFGGMAISLLFFGLSHLPLFLTYGIPDRHGIEHFPGLLISFSICIAILAITGVFTSIIWRQSKNLWLIAGLYASVSLLPELHRFITVWMQPK